MPPLTPLEIEYIDGRTYRVVEPFVYLVDGELIVVPSGFETDFASIPRPIWNLLPPTGKYGKAAVVHDYLYVMGGKIPEVPGRVFTKKEADRMFLDAMGDLDVPWYRFLMYQAVRWFGRGSF